MVTLYTIPYLYTASPVLLGGDVLQLLDKFLLQQTWFKYSESVFRTLENVTSKWGGRLTIWLRCVGSGTHLMVAGHQPQGLELKTYFIQIIPPDLCISTVPPELKVLVTEKPCKRLFNLSIYNRSLWVVYACWTWKEIDRKTPVPSMSQRKLVFLPSLTVAYTAWMFQKNTLWLLHLKTCFQNISVAHHHFICPRMGESRC